MSCCAVLGVTFLRLRRPFGLLELSLGSVITYRHLSQPVATSLDASKTGQEVQEQGPAQGPGLATLPAEVLSLIGQQLVAQRDKLNSVTTLPATWPPSPRPPSEPGNEHFLPQSQLWG